MRNLLVQLTEKKKLNEKSDLVLHFLDFLHRIRTNKL